MDDFQKYLWGFTFSALGTVLGWFLNQFSKWSGNRIEKKKLLNKVIFNLLETHHLILRLNIKPIYERALSIFLEKLDFSNNQSSKEDAKKDILAIVAPLLTNYIKPHLLADLSEHKKNHEEAIKLLSLLDPFTAYYLAGQPSIFDKIQIFEKSFKEGLSKISMDSINSDSEKEEFSEGLEQFFSDYFSPKLYEDSIEKLIEGIEDALISIAQKAGIRTKWKIKNHIKSSKSIENLNVDIEELISDLENLLN